MVPVGTGPVPVIETVTVRLEAELSVDDAGFTATVGVSDATVVVTVTLPVPLFTA